MFCMFVLATCQPVTVLHAPRSVIGLCWGQAGRERGQVGVKIESVSVNGRPLTESSIKQSAVVIALST